MHSPSEVAMLIVPVPIPAVSINAKDLESRKTSSMFVVMALATVVFLPSKSGSLSLLR
jgi:hypothetical protein